MKDYCITIGKKPKRETIIVKSRSPKKAVKMAEKWAELNQFGIDNPVINW